MEYRQQLRQVLTKLERIVLEQRQAVAAGGGDPAVFREAVARLRVALDGIGRVGFVALAQAGEESAGVLERAGVRYRFKQAVAKEWMTIWGKVTVLRRLYQADAGGPSWVPLDGRCGMAARFLTPELERLVVYLGAQLVPAEVEASLAEVLPEPVSRTAIQHVLTAVGGCAEAQADEVEVAVQQAAPLSVDGDVLVTSWDGVTVPLREAAPKRGRPAERPGVEDTRQMPTAWKEAAVGLVASYQTTAEGPQLQDVRYEARMPEAKMVTLMGRLAGQTAAALARGQYRQRVLLADGQREIWRRASEQPVYRDFTQIVDFYHATEHLSQAAEQLFGKSTPRADAWYERWRHRLRHQPGGVAQLLRSLRYYRRRLRSDRTRHQAVSQELTYFVHNRARMDYAGYRARGLPIGSGPVEAACKTVVGHRLKRSGMRWTRVGGQHILNLRVHVQSKRWESFWNWYLQYTDQRSRYELAA